MLLSASEGETYLLKGEGKLLEALQNVPKLLDEEGESWWCVLGALYRQRGQVKKAIDAYKEAASITPYSPYPLSNLALHQGINGHVDTMLQTYREVERLARQKTQANPADYWPYADLLIARLALGKIQAAEDTLKTLLQVVPRDLAYAVPGLLVALSRLSKILPDGANHIGEVVKYVREHVVEGKGLDGDVSLSNESFVIPFDGVPALGVQASNHDDPLKIIQMLDLAEPRPAIFILGGAMDMASEEMQATRPIIEEGLARYAQEHQVAIVDGGTHSGVMRLMGEARRKNAATFPLIGVAPINLVKYKGYDNPSSYDLDMGHSHFVLTSEGDWGDETDMIMQLAYALTGMGQCPGLGLVINGGNIVRQEVYRLTVSEQLKFPMLVLEGSGRFADTLAQAIRTGVTDDDEELQAIVAEGKIEVISVSAGTQGIQTRLRHYLSKAQNYS
jgi:tetratricopeptide (TPR) repeat protein